jgi:hypothetical protein
MPARLTTTAFCLIVPLVTFGQKPEVSLDEAIAELKAAPNDPRTVWFSGENKYTKPLRHLSQQEVDAKRREEVATLLEPLMLAKDRTNHGQVLHLVVKWGTEVNVPTLTSMLSLENSFDRDLAIRALGSIGGKNAAAALGKHILAKRDQQDVANQLKEMGAVAEPIAWDLIDTRDGWSTKYGYEILGAVGGSKSLVRLKALRGKKPKSSATEQMDKTIHAMELRLVKR